MSPHQEAGTALIEVLAALVLFAFAGAVVASTATLSIRSLRATAVRGRLVAFAARELAALQAAAVAVGDATERLAEPSVRGHVERSTTVDDDGVLATHRVTLTADPPAARVTLATRRLVPW
jgi:Tfp pilus assembly protein PilX